MEESFSRNSVQNELEQYVYQYSLVPAAKSKHWHSVQIGHLCRALLFGPSVSAQVAAEKPIMLWG